MAQPYMYGYAPNVQQGMVQPQQPPTITPQVQLQVPTMQQQYPAPQQQYYQQPYQQPQYQQPQYQQPYQQQPQYQQPQYQQPQYQQQIPQQPQIPPHLIAQIPQQPQSLIPNKHGQAQAWTPPPLTQAPAQGPTQAPTQVPQAPAPAGAPPSQVQVQEQEQRQRQIQAILDQQLQGGGAPQASASGPAPLLPPAPAQAQAPTQAPTQSPAQAQAPRAPQLVVTQTMLGLGREINGLLKSVQRCEIAAHGQQAVDLPELGVGVIQPPDLAATVQQVMAKAAQLLRTLDEAVQRGNPSVPIDVSERLVRYLVEQPDHLPQQF